MTPDELASLLAQGELARGGFVTDAKDPKVRLRALARKVAILWRASELTYTSEIRSIFEALHRAYAAALTEHGVMNLYDPRIGAVEVHYLVQLRAKVGAAFDHVAPAIRKASQESAQYTLRGISSTEQGLGEVMLRAREESIQLVEKAARAYAADVRAVLGDPANANLHPSTLRKLLVERGNVSLSRADLIARDQVLKVASALTLERMRRAGIGEYTWSGVMDARERKMHRALEGTRHPLTLAPVTNKQGERNHPGHDYRCRCVAIAWVAELDG